MNFLDLATDEDGYPSMGFEEFYQQGISCFEWGLPKPLVRQAFRHLCDVHKAKGGAVAMWQVRAFVYGLSGRYEGGLRSRKASAGYQWPAPPDASWELIVCIYPGGSFDLDLLHPVSCRFWSEDNGFFDVPTEDRSLMNCDWFESMGFDVMTMQPAMQVQIAGSEPPHLKLS